MHQIESIITNYQIEESIIALDETDEQKLLPILMPFIVIILT